MLKVLVIATSNKSRGGIATVVNAFTHQPQWSQYKCKWIKTHIDKGVIHKLWMLSTALIQYILLLPLYDIVHIHVSTTVSANRKYIFYKLAKIFGKKTIVHLHCGSQLSDIWNKKYEDMFVNADKCLTLSNGICDYIVSRTGKIDNVEVLYNPCPDIKGIDLSAKREKNILFAATLYKEKGYLDLIEAFGKIATKHPEWKLLLAGNGNPEEGIALAEKYNVTDRVKFLGWVRGEDKDKVFRTSSLFCLPSYAEGFPMAVLDAWAYGLPVVTTPVGGIPDIVVDGENGLLFNPGDVNALSKKLDTLIKDTELRKKLSQEARLLADTTFNVATITQQLADFYEMI